MPDASEHQEKIDIESPGTNDSSADQKGQDFWEAIRAAMEAQKQAPPLEPVSRDQDLPLSFAQERLWFLAKIGSNSAYNIPYTFRLNGSLNPQILEQSLIEVLNRHEALRSYFKEVD
ncbi:MAG: condensation domain-containing protein, partial [Cyanobacteria bacterium P01_A01_bin.17]